MTSRQLCAASAPTTVVVLACPEMKGTGLRSLAWELEKTGTDLCVAPALIDVVGPRTMIRPTAGLTLLHLDHPQLTDVQQVTKDLFDRCAAAAALLMLAPLLSVLAASICWMAAGRCCTSRSGWARTVVAFRMIQVPDHGYGCRDAPRGVADQQ